ncbi:MAG: ADP-glyceromanno-heptose 6-epimerase [Ignavibacteria bacterium]|nr:ADP-glyceromanno-heptose 6-epimerase [Ignavibacteria bacterium]
MILLTGGAGFIGSCLLRKLNDEGIKDIIVSDNLSKEDKWKNLRGKIFHTYVDKNELFDFLENNGVDDIEAIIHLGACSDTTEKDANYLLKNNYQFSQHLASIAFENDIRFIFASSAATYGDGSNGYSDRIFHNLKPLNCYGFSKHIFDLWIIENKLDTNCVGFKFFNVFGPNEYHKGNMASMVFKSFNQISDTGRVKLFKSYKQEFANGEQKRDFVYVKDCVDIIYKTIDNKEINGIFNLGTGTANSWNTLIKAVFSAMGRHPIIEYIDMPDNLKYQYQYFTVADINKLLEYFPNYEFTQLEDAVADYVQNYLLADDIYL